MWRYRLGAWGLACLAVALAAVPQPLLAQAGPESGAPRESVEARLGGKRITIEYGRPSLGGRTTKDLLALLPPDRVWRTGANESTTLRTEADVMVDDKRVPAGTYTLYLAWSEKEEWLLLLNRDPGIPLGTLWPEAPRERASVRYPWDGGYRRNILDKEVARVLLTLEPPSQPRELFTIELQPKQDAVVLTIGWGDQAGHTEVRRAP